MKKFLHCFIFVACFAALSCSKEVKAPITQSKSTVVTKTANTNNTNNTNTQNEHHCGDHSGSYNDGSHHAGG